MGGAAGATPRERGEFQIVTALLVIAARQI
jgi:hypothetical protein